MIRGTPLAEIVRILLRYCLIPIKRRQTSGAPPAFLIGFHPWKELVQLWLPEQRVTRVERTLSTWDFFSTWLPRILSDQRSEVYVWGYKVPAYIERVCERFRVPLIRVEDGFLRSIGLGETKVPPISLCFDRRGIYFDSTKESDLEQLIECYDFAADNALVERARVGIQLLLHSRLSKYNIPTASRVEEIYGPKVRKRVLVLGQLEGDMSLIKGCARKMTNDDVVRLAMHENPDSTIIYKPHPQVLQQMQRSLQPDPYAVEAMVLVLKEQITLADSLQTIDHVYTRTSLAGFEALLRGIHVTCIGMPFYAGWGITEDRQTSARRTARRSVEEVFAAAYLLYPRYFDVISKHEITFEEAIDLLQSMRAEHSE
jgi:capsular polysaccharide export protein